MGGVITRLGCRCGASSVPHVCIANSDIPPTSEQLRVLFLSNRLCVSIVNLTALPDSVLDGGAKCDE